MSAIPQTLSPGELLRIQAANAQGVKSMMDSNPGKAIPYFEEALTIHRDAGVLSNLGDALARSGRILEAKLVFEESIAIDPARDQAHYNLGVAREQLGDYEGARMAYLAAAERRVMPATMNNLANCEVWLVRLEEAEGHYRAAIKHGFGDAVWNLSICLLMQGKFREGWDFYHHRPQMRDYVHRPQIWRGESLKGRTLLIVTEQGLGDSIFALRYLPLLRERCARIMIACDWGLKRLVEAMVAADTRPELAPVQVIEKTASGMIPGIAFDFETLAMSLAGYLSPDGVGPRAPYLRARAVPMPPETLNVGLCWNGSTAVGLPAERNMPLKILKPLADIPGVRLVSLQKGDGVEEMASCGFAVADAMSSVKDVYDTACVIASLDLVITIDTLIPHLAGALGKPTWLMNRFASCWQWGTPKFDPQLYATVQQFRQARRGDWAPVVEQVAAALADFVAREKSA